MNDFVYGSLGGLTGILLSHPIDTIKTRIQSQKAQTIKDAVKMKKYYSGLSAPLIGVMLEKSIVFGFYELSKKHNLNNFVSGLIGGFMSTLIVTPIERIKINLQNKNELKGLNIKNIYRGFIPTIFRETPGFGIYFTTYNYLENNYNSKKNLFNNFLFGALSGLSAWIFIYPADLIKTKMQDNSSNKNVFETIKEIKSQNGFKGFYRGFHFAVSRAMPLHGGVFLGYEMSKRYLE